MKQVSTPKTSVEAKANMKQLKVDNWSTFFLQRLQLLFAKGDRCDLTLKFFTGQELKVHSLVLSTCTSHFDSMPKTDNVISLPESLSYNTVFPVINFMYSGKLEFKPELHSKLLAIAKILNITILHQLLVAHCKVEQPQTPKSEIAEIIVKKEISPKTSASIPLFSTNKKLPFWRKRSSFMRYDKKPYEEEPSPMRFKWPEMESVSTELQLLGSPSFAPLSYESEPIFKSPPPASVPQPPPQPLKRRIMESRVLEKHESDDDDDDRFDELQSFSSDEETPPLKPCLRTPTTSVPAAATKTPVTAPVTPSTKRVRFSLGPEGKENERVIPSPKPQLEEVQLQIQQPPQQQQPSQQQHSYNHAKIIAEVLKKYPDLVKNKNIKLKISSPRPNTTENGGTERTSYVVLKSTVKPYGPSQNVRQDGKMDKTWCCEHCKEYFGEYHSFRKHSQEIHNEKFDSRMCEYCGYKSSKRNLLLYHLFTKHNVTPPKNIRFPKCEDCSYIALTEALLLKHRNQHQLIKCEFCNLTFKSQSSYQSHQEICKPGSEMKTIKCESCNRVFKNVMGLNSHLKECTVKNVGNIFEEESSDRPIEMLEVPILERIDEEKDDIVEIPPGILIDDQIIPSSEADSLNSVASGIATSIGLTVALPSHQLTNNSTVILLDENSEFCDEYIVPDLITDEYNQQVPLISCPLVVGSKDSDKGQQVFYIPTSQSQGMIRLEQLRTQPGQLKTVNVQNTVVIPSKDEDMKVITVNGELGESSKDEIDSNDQYENVDSSLPKDTENKIESEDTVEKEEDERDKELPLTEKESLEQIEMDVERNSDMELVLCDQIQSDILSTKTVQEEEIPVTDQQTEVEKMDITNNLEGATFLLSDGVTMESMEIEKPTENCEEKQNEEASNSTDMVVESEDNLDLVQSEENLDMVQEEEKDESIEHSDSISEKTDVMETEILDSGTVTTKDDCVIVAVEQPIVSMSIDEQNGRANDLVKDWGFDDDDTEEIIEDPECKPCRPDIDDSSII